jgi:hypothetical protein
MTDDAPPSTAMICCSVFQVEVTALARNYWPNFTLRFPSSMLHMKPEQLASRLDSLVEAELKLGHRVVLIYGDCCVRMAAFGARPGVVRTGGNNCCELLLGHDEYRRLSHEGAFFLFPEWTHRWQEVFATALGLNRENATSLMQDLHRKLIYLDCGIVPVPESALRACAKYCGLPWEVREVSLESLHAAIHDALLRVKTKEGPA